MRNPGTTTNISETIFANDDPDTTQLTNGVFKTDARGLAIFYLTDQKRVDVLFTKAGVTSVTIPVDVQKSSLVSGAAVGSTVPPAIAAAGAAGASADAARADHTHSGSAYQALSEKGVASGYAPLGADSKVPAANLPAGGPLAITQYAPATLASPSTTSTSFVDVDATNLAATFTAPASGKVIVRLQARGEVSGTGGAMYFALRDGTTHVPKSQRFIGLVGLGDGLKQSGSIYVTGLTPGTSYTYKWAWRVGAGTATLYIEDGSEGSSKTPALMEVWAA